MEKQEKKSLFTLINNYSICIPAIQREYVQGYDEEKINIIRNNFINDIFKILQSKSNDKYLNINSIYGYIQEEKKQKIFFPVDGQQRLTTLCLIYWFLSVMEEDKENIDFPRNLLLYEIRDSATRFFEELFSLERYTYFRNLFLNKEFSFDKIISQEWFENEWLNDKTVISVINVISELYSRTLESNFDISFYSKARKNLSNIVFDLILIDSNDGRKQSCLEYAKINARGKKLELFENIKSILNLIEQNNNISNGFVYNYDNKYIDLFYDYFNRNDKDLEIITKEINDKTIIMLINVYNLFNELYDYYYELKSELDLYSFIKSQSDYDVSNNKFYWDKYISFFNNVLESLYEMDFCENEIRLFFGEFLERIIDFKNYKDSRKVICRILYYNYYKKHNKVFISKKIISKFDYVLDNLGYYKWKKYNFKNINYFIEQISKYEDIFKYFSIDYNDNQIETKIEQIKNDIYKFDKNSILDDIKVRIKEQVIKIEIINQNNLVYDYFNKWESVFEKKRSIYHLLYISNIWDAKNIKDYNFDLLSKYLYLANKYFNNDNNIDLKKLFAIATYYDKECCELYESNIINEKTNYRYIIPNSNYRIFLEDENLHNWKNEYYFISDNLDNEKIALINYKLDKLKLGYELIIENKFDSLKSILESDEYSNCWLRYAVSNNYLKLLDNKLSFENEKLYIQIYMEETPDGRYRKLNFFAYLYLLEENKKGFNTFNFSSPVYYLYDKNVRDTLSIDRYLNFNNYVNNKKIINPFELRIVWEEEKEKYHKTRDFFYFKYTLELDCNEDSLIMIDDNKNVIKKLIFNMRLNYVNKEIYNFKTFKSKIEGLIINETQTYTLLQEKINIYKFNNFESKKEVENEFEKFIFSKYDLKYHDYDYYNDIPIRKYLSKNSKSFYENDLDVD